MKEMPWRKLPRPWFADIGCGGAPAPFANILVDKFPGETRHRNARLYTDGKLFIEADVMALPFPDKSLDFVYCNHLLEHMDRPDLAATELQRVSDKGLIFVPGIRSEAVAQWHHPEKSVMHKWLSYRVDQKLFMVRCDTSKKDVTRERLILMGGWPAVAQGMWEEIRVGWGWGGWPKQIDMELFDIKPVLFGQERDDGEAVPE